MPILLHGFACLPSMWDALVAALPNEVAQDCTRVLLPGHGPAPVRPPTTRFEEAAELVAAALPQPPWHLVGYSLGARVAAAIAVAHPAEVEALTLIGVNAGLEEPQAVQARRQWDEEQARALERDGLETFIARWQQLPIFASQRRLPAEVREAQKRQRLDHDPAGLSWTMRVLGLGNMPPLAQRLAALPARLTLVVGADDSRVVAEGERLARLAPAARCHIVAGAGHNVPLEAPAELARILSPRSGTCTDDQLPS